MSILRARKVEMVAEIKDRFENSESTIFLDYRGLDVATVTKLRRQCREAGVEMKVIKNTLARIAADELGLSEINSQLVGTTAAFYGLEDPVAPAKVIEDFLKETRLNLQIKGGIVNGKVVEAEAVKNLAKLPDREVLLAQVLGTMVAPLTGFYSVLQGNTRNLVYALDALKNQKEEVAG